MPSFEQLRDTESPEITLIPLTLEYANSMYKLIQDKPVFLSQNGDRTGTKYENNEQFIRSIVFPKNPSCERYSILFQGILAGSINLTPLNDQGSVLEMDYWIGKEFTGQGIAFGSAKMLSDQALRRNGVREVVGFTHPDNLATQRTLLRAGFTNLGIAGIGADERCSFAKAES